MPTEDDKHITTYQPEEVLFSEGDPGGDLIFILEGAVVIYKQVDGHPIVLSNLGKGDIIGVMTAISKDPRTAFAKATQETKARVVSSHQFEKLMTTIPGWMKTMLKDLTDKVIKTNARVVTLDHQIEELEAALPSKWRLGLHVAEAFKLLGEMMLKDEGGSKYVVADDLRAKLRAIIRAKPQDLDRVFDVFEGTGFARLPTQLKDNKKWDWEAIMTIAGMGEYIDRLKRDRKRKTDLENVHFKDRKALFDLIDMTSYLKLAQTSEVTLNATDLVATMEKAVQKAYQPIAIEKAAVGLLVKLVKGTGDAGDQVSFVPNQLRRDLVYLEIYRTLRNKEPASKDKEAE